MQPTLKTPRRGTPPTFAPGQPGQTGAPATSKGYSRPGDRGSTGADRGGKALTGLVGGRVTDAPARETPFFWREGCPLATRNGPNFSLSTVDNWPVLRPIVDNF